MTALENIRRRRAARERAMSRPPEEPCKKCGCSLWGRDLEPDTWYCHMCGNTAYFTEHGYRQQFGRGLVMTAAAVEAPEAPETQETESAPCDL